MPELSPDSAIGPFSVDVDDLGASLHAAQARLDRYLGDAGVGQRPSYRANLVFEELTTNALKYGGSGIEPVHVRCTVRVDREELVLEFRDRGIEFDPTSAPVPSLPSSLSEAKVGGLGLELVRKISTAIDYLRENGENLTTVRISLERG